MRTYVLCALLPSFVALTAVACGEDAVDAGPAPLDEAGAPETSAAVDDSGSSVVDAPPPKEAGPSDADAHVDPPCSVNNGGCDPNATCASASGSVTCTCKPGFDGDGGTCADVDECETDNGGCSPEATCTNTAGGRTCTCKPGFDGDGGSCADVDECATNNGGCSANATCTNTPGGRTCACKPGYEGTGVGADCTLTTTTITRGTNLTMTGTGGRTCGDMVGYPVLALTSTTAQVSHPIGDGCLSPGDDILLMNMRAGILNTNTGNYELLKVTSVANDVVTFSAKTKSYGRSNGADDFIGVTGDDTQRVMIQRVPRYGNFVVAAGARATVWPWGGLNGGVFALSAAGAVTVNGEVDMIGRGYFGGARTATPNTTGKQGEAINGPGTSKQGAQLGGGGGGRGDGTGCGTYGSAGGGGGHGTPGAPGGDSECSGAGGIKYAHPTFAKLYLGSGGGAGGSDNDLATNPPGGYGGDGGGIIFIRADGPVTGTFLADGTDGEGDAVTNCLGAHAAFCWDYSGPGGGGAGGTILIDAPSFSGTARANGGLGGKGNANYARSGGNGGAGWVKTP